MSSTTGSDVIYTPPSTPALSICELDTMATSSYFDRYQVNHAFVPRPSATFTSEFARLAIHMGWEPSSAAYRNQRRQALVEEFDLHYGGSDKLENWQALCIEVEAYPIPTSIKQCKKALAGVHVNIQDLVDARRTGVRVQKFASVSALRRYSKREGKIFSKAIAKEDGFLKVFLRHFY